MATWNELSTEDQETYQSYQAQLRAAMADFHQVLNTFVELDTMWSGQVTSISTSLDNTEKAPNPTSLAGSVELTDTEVVNLTSHLQGALASYNTSGHKQLRNKAAGINATL